MNSLKVNDYIPNKEGEEEETLQEQETILVEVSSDRRQEVVILTSLSLKEDKLLLSKDFLRREDLQDISNL